MQLGILIHDLDSDDAVNRIRVLKPDFVILDSYHISDDMSTSIEELCQSMGIDVVTLFYTAPRVLQSNVKFYAQHYRIVSSPPTSFSIPEDEDEVGVSGDFSDIENFSDAFLARVNFLYPMIRMSEDLDSEDLQAIARSFLSLRERGFVGQFCPIILNWNKASSHVVELFVDSLGEHFERFSLWSLRFAMNGGWEMYKEIVVARTKKIEPEVVETPGSFQPINNGTVLHNGLGIRKAPAMAGHFVGRLSEGEHVEFDKFESKNNDRFLYGHIERGWVMIREGRTVYVDLENPVV